MKRSIFAAVLLAVAAAFAAPVFAQSAGQVQAQTPLTRDIGAILSLSTQAPGTVNSADQSGFNASRVVCVITQTANTGGTAATLTIQNKDAASGLYYNLVTSASVSVNGMVSPITAGVGITTVSNVSSNTHPLARTWRASVVLTGGTNWTGKVGCNLQ